jgi:hypothetical protein
MKRLTIPILILAAATALQAQALQTGTLQQQTDALEQILKIPPAARSEQLWLALAQKLEDEQALEHQRQDTFLATRNPSYVSGEQYSQHVNTLNTLWHDIRALPALIASASSGNNAIILIVQFGEAAVGPLVAAARQGHFSELSGVPDNRARLLVLQLVVEGGSVVMARNALAARIEPAQLSTESKQQIRDLARDLLKPGAVLPGILREVSSLALATGDPDLLQQVHLLVDSPSHLTDTTGIIDPNKLLQVQNLIRAALAEHQR